MGQKNQLAIHLRRKRGVVANALGLEPEHVSGQRAVAGQAKTFLSHSRVQDIVMPRVVLFNPSEFRLSQLPPFF